MAFEFQTSAEAASIERAQRMIQAARAGWPVVIRGAAPLLALPAETSTEGALAAFADAAAGPPVLLMAASRARNVLPSARAPSESVALRIANDGITPERLRGLADATLCRHVEAMVDAPLPELAPAAILLAKLAYLLPAVLVAPVTCSGALGLIGGTADDILAFPNVAATSLARIAEAPVPLADANDARLVAFRPRTGDTEHLALLIGQPEEVDGPLVRVHSQCFTGDLLGSLRCDCGPQLREAVRKMSSEGAGVLLYMAQEGRGIGLVNKLRAYALQDSGLDTLDANSALGWGVDERTFAPAAAMLHALGVTRIRLLTNNPDKVAQLAAHGIEVLGRVSHSIDANGLNNAYLETKARRFGHLFGI